MDTAAEAACLESLEAALATATPPDLGGYPARVVDGALQALVRRHGGAAAPLIHALAARAPTRSIRKAARLALYRLSRAGVAVAAPAPSTGPLVKRRAEEPIRAWLSAIDGTGSRAIWILFEGGLGGQLLLCSLILNDEAGVLEAAGGGITRKRLDAELRRLREHQKLPWVETDPARACALVRETLELHARLGTEPPPEFARWRRFFARRAADAGPQQAPPIAGEVDPLALDRSVELLDRPEFGGWFVDPGQIHEEALALLQARESRLVVSEQIKTEREAAIVDQVIDRQFDGAARRRWTRRLREMALILRNTGHEEPARLAAATVAALADDTRPARHIPFVRGLAVRGLTMGAEVALGRVKLADVSRAPARRTGA